MPEFSTQYSIREIVELKDFITVAYIIIDDIYQEVTPTYIKERRNIKDSMLSDSEIITIGIVGELLTIDSEKAWHSFCSKNLRDLFPNMCSRTRFNRTRRHLDKVIELIRDEITKRLGFSDNPHRVVDSMPIPVCHFGRAKFYRSLREHASYGYCASKKETYYGFKLHFMITLEGYITDFTVTAANIDDREALWDLVSKYHSLTILGDKGYLNKDFATDLKLEKNIDLVPIKRNNSKDQYSKPFRQLIFRLRRMIETVGSQLSCQLNIQKVLAKSKLGFTARIKTKILAHNLCCFVNKALGRDISRIKELVFG
jgi:uncharacterized protein YfbU (UPF0304 family)